jgi:hypothetical protein
MFEYKTILRNISLFEIERDTLFRTYAIRILGVTISGGNKESQSSRTKHLLAIIFTPNRFIMDILYFQIELKAKEKDELKKPFSESFDIEEEQLP